MRIRNYGRWEGHRPRGHHPPYCTGYGYNEAPRAAGGGLNFPPVAVFIAVAALLLFSAAGCGQVSSAPGSDSASTPSPLSKTLEPATDPAQAQEGSERAKDPAPSQRLDCEGQDFLNRVRADYAANRVRAGREYIGQRVCLKGKISDFSGSRGSVSVKVDVGEGVWFYLINKWDKGPDRTTEHEWAMAGMWKEWALSASVGDPVETECEIEALKIPGIPALTDCHRVVNGVVWTPPTPTPIPTSTPLPCTVAKFGDGRAWLNIDCTTEQVTIGAVNAPGAFEGFEILSAEDTVFVSFRFLYAGDRIAENIDGDYWERQVEGLSDGDGPALVWEAPSGVAAYIMSEWRYHDAKELGIYVNGECCSFNLDFDLTQPSAPAGTFWAATPAPTPPPTPTEAPAPTPAETPEPTPTPASAPTPTLPPPAPPGNGPLVATFINVPSSHDGDVIRLWLHLSEPTVASYKVLRDVAVQAQNGAVTETKRQDGRSDLWRVTVEPDGALDVTVVFTAPAECGYSASICTESGKALSNRPTVSIPYQD